MNKWILLGLLIAPVFSQAADQPGWLDRFTFKGDLRLRLEGREYHLDSRKNRNRARFRLRLSTDAKLTDQLKFHMRLSSGTGDPTSTNQTFDNSFSGKDLLIDRVQVTYSTGDWLVGGGKVKNPLHHTDLIWDSDVNPEGFFQQYKGSHFYANLAEFFLEEEATDADINLFVGQLGFRGGDAAKYNVSLAYYSYSNVAVDDYNFFDLLTTLTFKAGDTPIVLKMNYINNVTDYGSGFDDLDDTAWGVFAKFGSGKNPGQWTFAAKYAEIEALSTYISLADADFGFGDREGFVLSGVYRATKHVAWGANYFNTKGIRDSDDGDQHLQLDAVILF